MRILTPLVSRIISVIATVLVVRWLSRSLGVWPAFFTWSLGMAVGCGISAWLLRTSGVDRITWRNRVAGYFFSWGIMLGRTTLGWLTVSSWIVWVVLGATAIRSGIVPPIPAVETAVLDQPSQLWSILLFLAWAVDGGAFLYLLGFFLRSSGSRVNPSLLGPMAALVGMVVGSLALSGAGYSRWAVLLAGGPPLFLGLTYGAFLAAVLTFGRKVRWN